MSASSTSYSGRRATDPARPAKATAAAARRAALAAPAPWAQAGPAAIRRRSSVVRTTPRRRARPLAARWRPSSEPRAPASLARPRASLSAQTTPARRRPDRSAACIPRPATVAVVTTPIRLRRRQRNHITGKYLQGAYERTALLTYCLAIKIEERAHAAVLAPTTAPRAASRAAEATPARPIQRAACDHRRRWRQATADRRARPPPTDATALPLPL